MSINPQPVELPQRKPPSVLLSILLALIAGGIIWAAIDNVHPVFLVPKEFEAPSIGLPPEVYEANQRAQDRVNRYHAMLYLGSFGALLAVALGLAAAIAARSLAPLAIAPPLGALGGVAGGFFGCLVQEYVRTNVGQAELLHTIGAQLAVAAPMGLGIGLGLGLATRKSRPIIPTATAGLIAGILAAAIYPVAVSLLIPNASTDSLMPDTTHSRLLWLGIIAGLLGLIIPLAARRRAQRQ